MNNIVSLQEFKSISEWREFCEKQLLTITFLQSANEDLKKELENIKTFHPIEKIIVSPERALLEEQILLIQSRSYGKELSLEDVKKLDILLKNQKLLKESDKDLNGKSVSSTVPSDELMKIIQHGK